MSDVSTDTPTFKFKLGRLPKRDLALAPLRTYFEDGALPVAPAKCERALKVKYPMADNDRLGDCVVAGHIHLSQAVAEENGGTYTYPGDAATQTEYFVLTGGQDTGLSESTFLTTAQSTPILGSQVDVFGVLNHADRNEVKSGIYTFGGVFLGVNLPQSAENQFANQNPIWTVVPGSPIIGGHCIVAIGYDAEYVYVVTWGQVIRCTWAWFLEYVEEAYGILYTEQVSAGRGPLKGLDIARLRADIASLPQI